MKNRTSSQRPSSPSTTNGHSETKTTKGFNAENHKETWGRAVVTDSLTFVTVAALLLLTPFMAVYFYISCNHFDCELVTPLLDVFVHHTKTFYDIFQYTPQPTWFATKIGLGWLLYQMAMYLWFPGPTGYGQLTPAGHILEYKVNGLNVYIFSHILFIVGSFYLNLFSPSIIFDNWGPLLVFANIYGYLLATFSFIKAYLFPTHPNDRKFSGNFMYDYFMGIEFNPRIGNLDFKLFHNGRPGIVAWSLINLSSAAAQYQRWGYVTNSMIIVNILEAIYIIDFFYNEDWYLRTIDIAHDHFGWMLAWGDSVWLPFTYTLQAYYLVFHPNQLSNVEAAAIMGLGLFGFWIFRSVNHQKDYFRSKDGDCLIWGKPAKYLEVKFTTADGKTRSSKLLASGWWGLSRHFNYVGDLCLSLAYCLPCGFSHLFPYYYIIFMTILLVTRADRDDHRCAAKYGPKWVEYKKLVRWRILPYVY